jgi:hypothetical protein
LAGFDLQFLFKLFVAEHATPPSTRKRADQQIPLGIASTAALVSECLNG